MATIFDDIAGNEQAPGPITGTVFDDFQAEEPKQPLPYAHAEAEGWPPGISRLGPPEPEPEKQAEAEIASDIGAFTNIFRNPKEATKESIYEQYNLSKKLLQDNLQTAINPSLRGQVKAIPAKFKVILGALGVITSPLAPVFGVSENATREAALAVLKSQGFGQGYQKMVELGWIDPKSLKVNFENIGVLSGPDRPSTGSAIVDLAADIIAPLPPVAKGTAIARRTVRAGRAAKAGRATDIAEDIAGTAKRAEEAAPPPVAAKTPGFKAPAEPAPPPPVAPERAVVYPENPEPRLKFDELERKARLTEAQQRIMQAPESRVSKRELLGIEKKAKKARPGEPSLFEDEKDLFGSVGGYTTARKPGALPPSIEPPKPVRAKKPAPPALPKSQEEALAKFKQMEPVEPNKLAQKVEQLKTLPKEMQRLFTSEFTPLKTVEKKILTVAGKAIPEVDMARKFEQIAGAIAKAEADVIKFRRASIDPIADIADDFTEYIKIRRVKDRLTNDPVRKRVGSLTVEDADLALAGLKSKVGEADWARIERTAQAYQRETDKSLRLQVESGNMTEELYETIKAQNDFYAPFFVMKWAEENEAALAATGRKIATTQDLTKAITGMADEDMAIKNILQATAEQIVRSRMLAEKNLKMLEIDKLADLDQAGTWIKRAQPTRYYRIETDTAADILNQLSLQQTARKPQLLEQSLVKVGKAIQYAEEAGLKVRQKNLPKSLGRGTIGGVDTGGNISLRAFTSEVVAHELGHTFDVKIGSKIKNVFGVEREVPVRLSSQINAPRAINPLTGKKTIGRNEFQKELAALTDYTGLGGSAKYRASAAERFAEFINLYIHDPKTAHRLAPTWTDHFEKEILPNHQVKELVEKLSVFSRKVDRLPNIMTPLKELDDANYLTTAIRKAFPQRAPQIGVRFGTKPGPGKEIITYHKAGKDAALEVDKEIVKAIQGLNRAQTGVVAKVFAAGKTPLQWGATAANSAFQVRNLLFADLPRVTLMSRYGVRRIQDAYQFPMEWAYSLFTSIKGNFGHPNPLYMDFLESGAANSTIQRMLTPEPFRVTLGLPEKLTAGKIAKAPKTLILDNVAKFSNAIEETSKILGFKRGRDIENIVNLPPHLRASAMDKIVTEVRNFSGSPDFARHGEAAKNLNLLFMFFNARVQGIASDFARLAGKAGEKEMRSAWIRIGTSIGVPATMLALVNHLPGYIEDYEQIPQWEKDTYFMIPREKWFLNEDGIRVREYWRIPKREVTQLLGNMIDSVVSFAQKHDPEALINFSADFLANISPVNIEGETAMERIESIASSANPIIKSPFEMINKRDFFRHYNVIPQYMKGAPPEEQYRYTTPAAYVSLAKTPIAKGLGLSPLEIELLTRSTTSGGLTQFARQKTLPGRDKASSLPVAKIFYRQGRVAEPEEGEQAYEKARQAEVSEQLRRRRQADALMAKWEKEKLSNAERYQRIEQLSLEDQALADKLYDMQVEREKGISYHDKRIASLGVESGARANYILELAHNMDSKRRDTFLRNLINKRIMTPRVYSQVVQQMPEASLKETE